MEFYDRSAVFALTGGGGFNSQWDGILLYRANATAINLIFQFSTGWNPAKDFK